jgi:hypothetical protein
MISEQITTPWEAYFHAVDKGERCPELEPLIMTGAGAACHYARYVLRERWKEAEAVIMTDARAAYWYACDVLKRRWKEAESVIATGAEAAYWYEQHFNCKIRRGLLWKIKKIFVRRK